MDVEKSMDDNITMQNMKTAYQIIEDGIRDLDNKSFQMISILGIMMTVQVTVLPNTVTAIGAVFLFAAVNLTQVIYTWASKI